MHLSAYIKKKKPTERIRTKFGTNMGNQNYANVQSLSEFSTKNRRDLKFCLISHLVGCINSSKTLPPVK